MDIYKYANERDAAFTKFVMEDDWDAVLKHIKKYDISMPDNETIAKAGVYKAVQECTNIPKEVKEEAARKCILMGFKPTMY